MIRILALFACLLLSTTSRAQSNDGEIMVDGETNTAYMAPIDSLHLPPFDQNGSVISMQWPYLYNTAWLSPWPIHEGMNVSLGAYVTTGFGRNAPSGTGFGQNAALLYAVPLSQRLSVAAGAYLNNFSWGGAQWREAGLSAVLSYRFNNHWEAAIYGNKALANRYSSPLFRANPATWALPYSVGDRIGASVTYNFTPSMSIQLSVERVSLPHNEPFAQPYGERNRP